MTQTLTTLISPQPLHLVKWCKQVVALFDRQHVTVAITVGAENGSSVRRFTVQAVDRLHGAKNPRPVGRVVPVRFIVGTDDTGEPGGTQTVTTVTGTHVQTVVANQAADILTDDSGLIEVDIEVTGAGTRYVRVQVGSETVSTGVVAWA